MGAKKKKKKPKTPATQKQCTLLSQLILCMCNPYSFLNFFFFVKKKQIYTEEK